MLMLVSVFSTAGLITSSTGLGKKPRTRSTAISGATTNFSRRSRSGIPNAGFFGEPGRTCAASSGEPATANAGSFGAPVIMRWYIHRM